MTKLNPLKKLRSTTAARLIVSLYDAGLAWLCMFAVMHWRFAMSSQRIPDNMAEKAAFVFMACCLGVWLISGLSKAVWRYTSLEDVIALGRNVVFITLLTALVLFVALDRAANFPRAVPFITAAVFFAALIASRAAIMTYYKGDIRSLFAKAKDIRNSAILIGRSDYLHDYLRDKTRGSIFGTYRVTGLIDTGGDFKGRSIRGVPVLGNVEDLPMAARKLTPGNAAPPTLIMIDAVADKPLLNTLVKTASEMGSTLVRGGGGTKDGLTPLEAADLIGRDAKALDITPVRQLIEGKRVLITGAGGTIGSELTRQVSGLNPARLILVDHAEFNLYQIDQELSSLTQCDWHPYLGDIQDMAHMREIFDTERPEIILHAAALKHVPLSETNPLEAISINVGGTKNIIELATEFGTDSFTLISTDKAVKPVNVMGATKRIAEMMTLAAATQSPTLSSCAVRFGNVLASAGSVVPLFERQISQGGPITVTHEDATRYFMTVEEAGALVLQAAALSAVQRKEMAAVYVLDMGDPVNIGKLARQLVRLRGLVPDRDIEIKYTGLRAGEKIAEELTDIQENLASTYVEGVQRFTGKIVDPKSVHRRIDKLLEATLAREKSGARKALHKLLPEYEPNGSLTD